MRVTFGLDLDSRAWPHPLSQADAAINHAVVGPAGWLDLLETALGLTAPPGASSLRVARYAERLVRADAPTRFYHRSLAVDRWGTARTLLAWRDALVTAGWEPGKSPSARIADLSAVEAVPSPALQPGLPERLRAVLAHASRAGDRIESVTLVDPPEDIPPIYRDLLNALGSPVTLPSPPTPPATARTSSAPARPAPTTDLHRLQHQLTHPDAPPTAPQGDGSVLRLVASDPHQAADALAAWLAANPGQHKDALVIRGPRADVLDEALRRHGLPPLGTDRRSRWRPAAQVLPLALAVAWQPLDPLALLELLMLPTGPLPRRAASLLAATLREYPGIRGERWDQAWETAVADAERRALAQAEADGTAADAGEAAQRTRDHLDRWLGPGCIAVHDPRRGIAPDAARAIAGRVAHWARTRLIHDEADTVFPAVRNQALEFREILENCGEFPLPRTQIEQMLETVQGDGVPWQSPGAAGRLAFVDAPGAMFGPAPLVIWWNFTAPAPPAAPPPWTAAERTALGLPDPADAARSRARRGRRPVHCATRRLILVTPLAADGAALDAHPLYDEIHARFCPTPGDEARITHTRVPTGRSPAVRLVPPRPQREPDPLWILPPDRVAARREESSHSLESLLGCPLQWVLRYAAALQPGALHGFDDRAVQGHAAHAVLQDLLQQDPLPDPQRVAALAAEALQQRLPQQAATLLRPERTADRRRFEADVMRAAARLLDALHAAGMRVAGIEEERSQTFSEGTLQGYLDVLLAAPDGRPALLDLKLGGAKFRREILEKGVAVQLAVYAQLAGAENRVGYFIVDRGELLVLDPEAFPRGRTVVGSSMPDTWERLIRSYAARMAQLQAGEIRATGLPDAASQGLELALDPPCRFCDYPALCGRKERDDERPDRHRRRG